MKLINKLLICLSVVAAGCGDLELPESESSIKSQAITNEAVTVPTNWYYYYDITANQVSAKIREKGSRIVDFQVESTNPTKFTLSMVKNAGAHKRTWWWYHGLTHNQLKAKLVEKNARIVNLQRYNDGGMKFAAILAPNNGANQKSWWFYFDLTSKQVSQKLKVNNARLIDIQTRGKGSAKRFTVVMVKNTGADARAWWWYHGITTAQITEKLNKNKAMLFDIQKESNGLFSVVMTRAKKPIKWWWYFDSTTSLLDSKAAEKGARIERISSWGKGSQRRITAIFVDNSY